MTIRTTNGEVFSDAEQRALARLVFKRFGKDKAAFSAAWRRMLQNNAEDHEIAKLLDERYSQERQHLKGDLMRDGVLEAREFRVDLLDVHSCEILRRHLRRVKNSAEEKGRRKAIRQPWRG